MSVPVYVSIGSNLGDLRFNVNFGITEMKKLSKDDKITISRLYKTQAWGTGEAQGDFINAVAKFSVALKPLELLEALITIEKSAGRKHDVNRWSPRELDLDILLYGSEVISSDRLIVPHALMTERLFVLQPLVDLAPDLIIPGRNVTVKALLHRCQDNRRVDVIESSQIQTL